MRRHKKLFALIFVFTLIFVSFIVYEFNRFYSHQIDYNLRLFSEEKILTAKERLDFYAEDLQKKLFHRMLLGEKRYQNFVKGINDVKNTDNSEQHLEHIEPFLFLSFLVKDVKNSKKDFNVKIESLDKKKKEMNLKVNKTLAWKPKWLISSRMVFKKEALAWLEKELSKIPLSSILSSPLNIHKDIFFLSIDGPSSYPLVAFLSRFKGRSKEALKKAELKEEVLGLGVLPLSFFSNLSELTKTSPGHLSLVTHEGFILIHPEQGYIGSSFKHHPLLGEISQDTSRSQGVSSKTLRYFKNKEVVSSYIGLSNSNLYAIMDETHSLSPQGLMQFLFERIFLKVFILVLVFLIFVYVTLRSNFKSDSKPFSYLKKSIQDLLLYKSIKEPPFDDSESVFILKKLKEKIDLTKPNFEKNKEEILEKRKSFQSEMKNYFSEIRDSLMTLFAHIQLLRLKILKTDRLHQSDALHKNNKANDVQKTNQFVQTNEEVQKIEEHFNSIEKEIQLMKSWLGEREPTLKAPRLEAPILKASRLETPMTLSKRIEIHKKKLEGEEEFQFFNIPSSKSKGSLKENI